MTGASEQTMRVTHVNANWTPGDPGGDGSFELMIVTEDGERHTVSLSAAAAAAVTALIRPGTVPLWDLSAGCLIVANVVGQWIRDDWSATPASAPAPAPAPAPTPAPAEDAAKPGQPPE